MERLVPVVGQRGGGEEHERARERGIEEVSEKKTEPKNVCKRAERGGGTKHTHVLDLLPVEDVVPHHVGLSVAVLASLGDGNLLNL